MSERGFTDFVRTKLNPIIGSCFHEGAGRVQFGAGTEFPTSGLTYTVQQTDELVRRLTTWIEAQRELKGSRNFPGEDPCPDYDRGVEDCVLSLLSDLRGVAETKEPERG